MEFPEERWIMAGTGVRLMQKAAFQLFGPDPGGRPAGAENKASSGHRRYMMNIQPAPETPREVPEADALEQQTPILPEGSDEVGAINPLPDDASEADAIEQRTGVLPGGAGPAGVAGVSEADAAEADLIEQALAPSFDDEEDYPEGGVPGGTAQE
jgi:hypothetical protein